MGKHSNKKEHWEDVYNSKNDLEVSWFQERPTASLDLIKSLNLKNDAAIIDIGGGNSNFTIELLKQGFTNLSVLDISAKALNRTKTKIGKKADQIQWIVSDILDVQFDQKHDVWHDRATFHFLTNNDDIEKYVTTVTNAIKSGSYLILATFSTSGPQKCSGLEITQYSKEMLKNLLKENFELVKAFEEVHKTPFNTEQNFIYTLFRKS